MYTYILLSLVPDILRYAETSLFWRKLLDQYVPFNLLTDGFEVPESWKDNDAGEITICACRDELTMLL